MQCFKPIKIVKNLSPEYYPNGLEVGCGKCLGCRVHLRREWTLRCYHELSAHPRAVFITLTYDNDNLPEFGSLRKRHMQLFLKRLRKRIEPRQIRYVLTGEYGSTRYTERPHYHGIIFGLGFDFYTVGILKELWKYQSYWSSKNFGFATWQSISYVAGYLHKINGNLDSRQNTWYPREKPFRMLSQGLGKEWLTKHSDMLERDGYVSHRGRALSIPRYYLNKIDPPVPNSPPSDHPLRVILRQTSSEKRAELIKIFTGVENIDDPLLLSHDKWLKYFKGNASARSYNASMIYEQLRRSYFRKNMI